MDREETDFKRRTEQLQQRLKDVELEKEFIAKEAQLREKQRELKQITKEVHPSKLKEFITSIKSMMNELHEFAEEHRKQKELEKVT